MLKRNYDLLRFDELDFMDAILRYNSMLDKGGDFLLEEYKGRAGEFLAEYKDDISTNALHMILSYEGMTLLIISYVYDKSDYTEKEHNRIRAICVRRMITVLTSRGLPHIKASVTAGEPHLYDFVRESYDKRNFSEN